MSQPQTPTPPNKTRRRLSFFLRLAVGLIVLGVIIWQTDFTQLTEALGNINPWWLVGAFGAQIVGNFLIWPLRWSLLLNLYDIPAPFVRLVKAVYVGSFFGHFLPTSFGGDVYRAYWILDDKSQYRKSFFVIFVERFIGLVLLGYIALPAFIVLLVQRSAGGGIFVPILGLMVLVAASILLLNPNVYRFLDRLVFRDRKLLQSWRAKLAEALVFLHESPRKAQIYLLSLLVQLDGIVYFYCIGMALGLPLEFWHYFVVVPPTVVATMLIPISFNGLGVREASLVLLTSAIGLAVSPAEAVALGLLALVITLINSLFGGLFYIMGKGEATLPTLQIAEAENVGERT
ncbi:MAG: flippase-like domain-containing protein [Anaerolineae bacterium]|nr:flippase-like domain-containing protein [Anaerolineae bacterium]